MKFTILCLVCSVSVLVDCYSTSKLTRSENKIWWQDTIFYQIYPRSFKDSDKDGIGDLKGITEKLSYLNKTGITATWLSPIFKSPMRDFGYDISDFRDIQDEYGTLDDFEKMIEQANRLGIKIILDFVPNHSSDQHEWFKKSVRKEKGYENYYVWHPGTKDKDGNPVPPNNWVSVFRGSAWTWNEERQEFYYHQFLKEQPDLNFREEKVIKEMQDVLTYWLDKGVFGFRVDAVLHLIEDEKLRDEPPSGAEGQTPEDWGYYSHIYTVNQPENLDIVRGWREAMDNWSMKNDGIERVMMTEAYADIPSILKYYENGASFSFNFNLLIDLNGDSTTDNYVQVINKWLSEAPINKYTPNWVLGNHDNPRMATRYHKERVDGLNMLIQMLPGVAITYNGEEIGMPNGHVTWEQHQDNACHEDDFLTSCRDFERTPFQWDQTEYAGFTESETPWLPVDSSRKTINVQTEDDSHESHYHVYQKMVQHRKLDTLRYGDVEVKKVGESVLYVLRSLRGEDGYLLLFNLENKEESINLDEFETNLKVVVKGVKNSHRLNEVLEKGKPFVLKGYETYVLKIEKN